MPNGKYAGMRPYHVISKKPATASVHRQYRRDPGFALIVTLMLMVLLVVLAIGMLSLSSIGQRTSMQGKNMVAARANARLAMMVALGDLQKYAGPDQRVTAPAGIGRGLQSPPRPFTRNTHWTGVWSTTSLDADKNPDPTKPMIGTNLDLTDAAIPATHRTGLLTDRRNLDTTNLSAGKWNNNLRLAWLVSGTYSNTSSSANSPVYTNRNPTASATTINKVKLVGTGTLGTSLVDPLADPVNVPMVGFPPRATAGSEPNGFAWWVGDENAKAKISVTHPYAGKNPSTSQGSAGGYYRLAGAEPPAIATVKSRTAMPYAPIGALDSAGRPKLVTVEEASLAGAAGAITPDHLKNNYYDLSAQALTVQSNARRGGLKKDLTTLLEQRRTGAARGVSLSSNPLRLDEVYPETPIIPSPWHTFTGPRYDHLYAWYRLMDELVGSKVGEYSLAPRYLDARQSTAERGITEGWTLNHLEKNGATYSTMPITLQPQMVDFKLHFDFTRDDSRAGGRAVRSHLYPRLVLWNPYNVKLAARRYVVMAAQYPWGGLRIGGYGLSSISGTGSVDANLYPGLKNGFAFTTEATELEPGQCLVFTPDSTASGGPVIGGNSARYDVADISRNVLSAKKPADRQNFHFDCDLKINDAVDFTQPQIPYGVPFDVNGNIATGQMVFLLKRAPETGSITPTVLTQSMDYATICRQVCHYQGHGDYFWWYVPNMNNHPANDAPAGFVTHGSNPQRNPPRLWYTEARQRWFDESMEQQALGQHWGSGASVWYNVPLIAAYNVRAPLVHRSQFCFYDDWTRYSPAGVMLPWVSERTFGTPKDAPYISGKSAGSPWGLAGDWAAVEGRYPMFDLPSPDVGVFSLASFQHAGLGFESWLPSYIIGHSLAEARSDRDATAKRAYLSAHAVAGPPGSKPWDVEFRKAWTATWHDLVMAAEQPNELLAYDIAYETNHNLWDDYFLSTIPFQRNSATPKITWDATKPLPNSRNVINTWLGTSQAELVKKISAPPAGAGYRDPSAYPFHHAAAFLLTDGGFNVNSTSIEAWRALLSACNDLIRPALSGGGVTGVNFSRLLVPPASANGTGLVTSGAWNGTTVLTDDQVTRLATEIVEEVKARGPFLSLSDFINRRLATSLTSSTPTSPMAKQDPYDQSTRGPLQAAIERANINQSLQQASAMYTINRTGGMIGNGGGGQVTDYDAMPDYKTYGMPGYLTQADILQRIGSQLTVRGDTFVIRTYGETRDASGRAIGKVWCEAVVQRLPEYLQGRDIDDYNATGPGNHPTEPLTLVGADGSLISNDRITDINKRFGRRFVIQSFRWLLPDEI